MSWESRFSFEAIGTSWILEFSGAKNMAPELILEKVKKEISDFSNFFSRFDKSSKIWQGSKTAGQIKIPEKYLKLVNLYENLYKQSYGLFTPLVGNLLSESGYDEEYSLKPKKINPVPAWNEVLSLKDGNLEFKKPWLLDFGAAGKGFIIDLVAKLLESNEINSYCIDAGGDILYKNPNNEILKIGLEHPEDFSKVVGITNLEKGSICGSSGNRRKWGNYHHIFNPNKLDSVRDVLAVWVTSSDAVTADAISTCLFFVDPKIFSANFKFEYLIIYPDYTFKKSSNFPGELYLA